MDAKEKAIELAEKMAIYHWTNVCNYEEAKQCALIAVDEIIYEHNLHLTQFGHERILFWQEVKQELEKL